MLRRTGVLRIGGRRIGSLLLFANLVVLCSLFSTDALGQMANAGSVSGQVTDPSNAVVPDASVKLTDPSTGITQSTTTNASGRYVFSNVPPGTYTLSVEKQGFNTTTIPSQPVRVGVPLTQDLKLQVGAATQVVEVQATNAELQTENATIGNTVSGLALNSLPSLNRDVSTFVELQPGVSPDGSVAGAVVDQSSFQLDGGNNTNDMDGSMSVYTPTYAGDPTGGVSNQSFAVAAGPTGVMPTPADSVEEFKVNSANQTADFNSSSGAQVQMVTRRGTEAGTSTTSTTIFPPTHGTTTLPERRFPIGIAVGLEHGLADLSSRKKFSGGRPSSSPITKVFGGPLRERSNAPCHPLRCGPACSRLMGLRTIWQPRTRAVSESIRWCSKCGTPTCRLPTNPAAD